MDATEKNGVAVIGDRDSVMLFNAVGITPVYAETESEIENEIHRLAREGYRVIFITERAAREAPLAVSRYKSQAFPAIIPIPDRHGSDGYGMRNISANVEKAIGTDILFKEED